jgi:5-methylcytosine-specific restriction protein A
MPMSPADVQKYDRFRGGARARGYDADWDRARRAHAAVEPLCRRCAQRGLDVPMSVVDHIVPIPVAPELRLEDGNLQSLCHTCHSAKSREDRRRWPLLVGRAWAL